MDEYIHIYKIPRSQVQQIEPSRDSRTESCVENRKSRHDYEPVTFTQGASDNNQQPEFNDLSMVQTIRKDEMDAKQRIKKLFCLFSIIGIVVSAAMMVIVAVSVSIIAIRSNALSNQVADLQQQFQELNSVQVKDNLLSSHGITIRVPKISIVIKCGPVAILAPWIRCAQQ